MKNEHHHWIVHIRISLGTTFQLKLTIESFWTKFTQKGCFPSKTVKTTIETSKDHNWILDILIIVATKLELKLTILIFFVQLCLKWCFSSKTEKVDTGIEFCVFEFVLELVLCHWILRIRINFFWPNCPKRVLAVKNWKIALVHPSMVGTYYIKPFRTGIDRYNVSTPSQREKGTWIKQIYFFKWNF